MRCSASSIAPTSIARALGSLDRPLQRRERDPGVAAPALRQHLQGGVLDRRRIGQSPLGIAQRPPQDLLDLRGLQRPQLVDLAAREQRRVDLEVGVLGGRPDQRQQPFLDRRQQRVLLGLVEAVDLVEEEDRRPARALPALAGALDHRADLGFAGVDRRLLLERPLGPGRGDPRQRRLPRPRRPVEDRAVRTPALDRRPQRRSLAQHVLLPNQLVQALRPHPHASGASASGTRRAARRALAIEQSVVHYG